MKIKTQSYILMLGIVIMPILVISLFVVVERISFASREASRYEELRLESASSDVKERVRRITEHKPNGIDMAIADPGGRVVYSSIRSIPEGSVFKDALYSTALRPPSGRAIVFGFTPPLPPGYVAVASLSRSEFIPSRLFDDYLVLGIVLLAAILVFAAAMSINILRSITRSVLSLEAATRRVAAGELDLPIAIEGSNEIASLSRSLNSLRQEIKDDQSRRARFIMGISHDLKTPLALVKGYAEALEEELGDAGEDASSHLGIIQSKADQLEGMIDDLIDFVRVDTGEWSRGLKSVELGQFLRAFAKRVEADALLLGREAKGRIELPEPAPVRMDESLVSRALDNLVNNALRYTSPGGTIHIAAHAEAKAFLVSVSDDGPGIASEDLPHIFEPFYRGSSSRREQGMGLGLSIVKTVVESHGWEIEVRPGEGKGVSFVLSIPREASS
jgi:signal transduction histidine kinase